LVTVQEVGGECRRREKVACWVSSQPVVEGLATCVYLGQPRKKREGDLLGILVAAGSHLVFVHP